MLRHFSVHPVDMKSARGAMILTLQLFARHRSRVASAAISDRLRLLPHMGLPLNDAQDATFWLGFSAVMKNATLIEIGGRRCIRRVRAPASRSSIHDKVMPLHIFIDSNIYLSFYSASNNDLNQLSRITSLVNSGAVRVIVTAQVEREVARNRDNKLSASLSEFEKHVLKLPAIPRFMSEYDEVKSLKQHIGNAIKTRQEAAARARKEATNLATQADIVIQEIFDAAGIISDSDDAFNRAHRRMVLGEPPGKATSLGDRLNWEHILSETPMYDDVHIITRDGDFRSDLDERSPHHSLNIEWRTKKRSNMYVHSELTKFLSSRFSEFSNKAPILEPKSAINAKSFEELEKLRESVRAYEIRKSIIDDFSEAEDDTSAGNAIEKLQAGISYLAPADIKTVLDICLSNPAFYHYECDDQVRDFILGIIPIIYHLLSKKEIAEIEYTFGVEVEQPDFDDTPDLFSPNYAALDLEDLDRFAEKNKEQRYDDLDLDDIY